LICNLKSYHVFSDMLSYKKMLENLDMDHLILCPSFPFLPIMHSSKYLLGAQDVSYDGDGNHTSMVTAAALKSISVDAVLIGHSEVNDPFERKIAKIKQVLMSQMQVYIILSDSKSDYDYQYTSLKLLAQIRGILSQVIKRDYHLITFVYEPSWLVGGGETLNIDDVENIFYFMKKELERDYQYSFPFFYGGGLTAKNVMPYYESEHIDGLLLGSFCFDPQNVAKFVESIHIRHK